MKKTRCLLVDDEPLAIALMQKHIGQLDFMEVTATSPNALKALEILKKNGSRPDVPRYQHAGYKWNRFFKDAAKPAKSNRHNSLPSVCAGRL